MTAILFVLAILGIPILFALFYTPKAHNHRTLHAYSSLTKSCMKDDYPSEEEVFQTLKDANIGPCFLDVD